MKTCTSLPSSFSPIIVGRAPVTIRVTALSRQRPPDARRGNALLLLPSWTLSENSVNMPPKRLKPYQSLNKHLGSINLTLYTSENLAILLNQRRTSQCRDLCLLSKAIIWQSLIVEIGTSLLPVLSFFVVSGWLLLG